MWPNDFQMIRQSHDFMILPDLDFLDSALCRTETQLDRPSQRGELYVDCPWVKDRYHIEPRFVPAMKVLNFDSGTVMLYVKRSPLTHLAKQDTARWRISG